MVTYSSFAQRAVRTLRATLTNTLSTTRLGRCFKLISAYRRNPNLLQLLVRAKLPPVKTTSRKAHTLKTVRNTSKTTAYTLPRHISRTQANCLYIIKCCQCGKLYVRETRNPLNDRLTQHKSVIQTRTGSSSHLVAHFQRHVLHNLLMRPLEHNPHWTVAERQQREATWIRRLNTYYPHGLKDRKPCRSRT